VRSDEVIALFQDDQRGVWVRHYQGWSDDVNRATMYLGNSDKDYKGFLTEKGMPRYQVEGEVNGTKLQLLVLDSNQLVVGYIQGMVDEDQLIADWRLTDLDLERKLFLERVAQLTNASDCGANKWIKEFNGKFMEDDAVVLIQKEEQGGLQGYIHMADQKKTYELNGECLDVECNEAQLNLTNHKGKKLATMVWTDLQDGLAQGALDNNQVYIFNEGRKLSMVCGSQIVGGVQLSYVFPSLSNEDFDIWMRKRINTWLKGYEIDKTDLSDGLEDARLWVDLDLVTEGIISGIITQDHHRRGLVREGFIFDLDKGKALKKDDWLNDVEEFEDFAEKAIEGEKQRDRIQEEEVTLEWFDDLTFDHISFRKEGLCLRSEFSRIYGERKVIMPWGILEKQLKRPRQLAKKLN
jgi:hypothetical protein